MMVSALAAAALAPVAKARAVGVAGLPVVADAGAVAGAVAVAGAAAIRVDFAVIAAFAS